MLHSFKMSLCSFNYYESLFHVWNRLHTKYLIWFHGHEMCLGQVCSGACAGYMVVCAVLFSCSVRRPCGTDPQWTPPPSSHPSFHLWPCVVSAGRSAVHLWIQRSCCKNVFDLAFFQEFQMFPRAAIVWTNLHMATVIVCRLRTDRPREASAG